MKIKTKNRSHRYGKNRPRFRHGHKYRTYKKCLSIMMLIYILSNTYAAYEAQFMKKLSNTETELKKNVAYKEVCNGSGLRTLVFGYFRVSIYCLLT